MTTATDTVNMSLRVNKSLKQQADMLFRDLGMNTSVAINMFLAQSVREQALPFRSSKAHSISPELATAIKEADNIVTGRVEAKKYNSFEELVADLDNE